MAEQEEVKRVIELIKMIREPEQRDEALMELGKIRETFQNLAIFLWYSVGTIAILIQEIVAIYPFLSPPSLSQANS